MPVAVSRTRTNRNKYGREPKVTLRWDYPLLRSLFASHWPPLHVNGASDLSPASSRSREASRRRPLLLEHRFV